MTLELGGPGSSDEQKEGDFTSSLELLTRFSEFSRRIDAEKLKAESLLPFSWMRQFSRLTPQIYPATR